MLFFKLCVRENSAGKLYAQFWGCFWTRLGILRSPMWFVFRKSKYSRNYTAVRGKVLLGSNLGHYITITAATICRRVCCGRRALVQLRLAKASLRPALSSATRVEGPLNNVQNNSFVLVPRLYNNLLCILQNPDGIMKKVRPNMLNISDKFRICF